MAERLVIQIVTTGGDSARRESQKAASGLASVEKGAGRTRTALLGSAKSAVKFAATGVGVAGFAIGVAKTVGAVVDMDRAMRNVNSIAGMNEKQLASMRGELVKLGGKTAQAPVTLAEGLYDLVSSGFDAQQSLKILRSSAVAATAGLTTTEVSTKAVAAVLNAYRLPAGQAAAVSDTLFQTVKRGVISFEELASNIGDVLPFAATLGIDLRQVGASISTMTKAGISAPETMTRIKAAMQSFIKPSEGMKQGLKEIGVESGEALIKQKGFQGALEAMIGTTDGSKEAVAKLFPNIRALGAAFALTGKNTREARADVRGMKDDTGAAAKTFQEQSKSISFAWNQVKASAAGVAIQIGSHFVPAIAGALRVLAQLPSHVGTAVDALSRVSLVQNLVQVVKDFASTLADVAGAAADVGGALGTVVGPIAGIAGDFLQSGVAVRLFNTALGALVGYAAAFAVRWAAVAAAIQIGRIVSAIAAVKGLGAALQAATAAAAANPWTALAVVLGAAAGALGLFGGSQQSAADATRELNDAITQQRQLLDELSGIQITQQAAQAQVTLAQDRLRVATNEVSRAVKKYGADSRQARLAEAQRAIASEDLQRTQQQLGEIEASTGEKAVKAQEDAKSALDKTKDALDDANDGVKQAQKFGHGQAEALEKQKAAQENYNKALRNFNRTMDVVAQSSGFGKRAADALTKSLQKVPPKVRTKIETADEDAKRKLAAVMARLRAADGEKAVQRILGNATNAQSAIAAAQARLSAIDGSTATVYVRGVNAIQGIQGNQAGGPVFPGSWMNRALGGSVPGAGRGDRVPLMGEPGEFMMKRSAVNRYGLSAMYAVNRGDAEIVGYQDGGAITAGNTPKRKKSGSSKPKKKGRKLPSAKELLKTRIPGVSGAPIDVLRDQIEQTRRAVEDAARLADLTTEEFLVENPDYDPDSSNKELRRRELVDPAAVAQRVAEIDELLLGGPTAGNPGGYYHLKNLFDPQLLDTLKQIEGRYTTAIQAAKNLVDQIEDRVKKLNARIEAWKKKARDERHRPIKGSSEKAKNADRELRRKTAEGYDKEADKVRKTRDRLLERKRNTTSRRKGWIDSRRELERERTLQLPWDVKDVIYEYTRLGRERGEVLGTKSAEPDELDKDKADTDAGSDEYARLLEEKVQGLQRELAVGRIQDPIFRDFLGSFAGGLSRVPRDGLAYVHKDEGIVPADGGPGLVPKLDLHLHGPGMDALIERAELVVDGKLTEIAVKSGRSRTFPGRPGRVATYRTN